MNLLQVTLISLLGYLTYIHTPFLGGGLIGWYCIGGSRSQWFRTA